MHIVSLATLGVRSLTGLAPVPHGGATADLTPMSAPSFLHGVSSLSSHPFPPAWPSQRRSRAVPAGRVPGARLRPAVAQPRRAHHLLPLRSSRDPAAAAGWMLCLLE